MKLDVPFFWQYDTAIDEGWRHRACTMTSLSMVLNFFGKKIQPQEVITEGLTLKGAYIENVGWDHRATSWIAHNHGVRAYSEEFRSLIDGKPSEFSEMFVDAGIAKIKKMVTLGFPVLASIKIDFQEQDNPHTIVIVGIAPNGNLIYHDSKYEDGGYREVSEEVFRKAWRRFVVFFEK